MKKPAPAASTQFGHQDTQPWYKNYMVLIFVIGLPLFVVVSCIWFVFYSIEVKDSVVRDDWYMDGKTLYQDVSRDKLAHDLGLQGQMVFTKLPQSEDYEIDFWLDYPADSLQSGNLPNGVPVTYPDMLTLSISHATDIHKDHDTVLKHVSDNQYHATISNFDPLPAKYYVQVSNEEALNWRLREVGKLPQSKITFAPLSSFN